MNTFLGAAGLVLALAAGHPPEAGKAKGPPAALALLEDCGPDFLGALSATDGGSQVRRDFCDYYSGVCSVRVTPMQRYNPRLPGWNYPIAEKPGPGQYRYLRFAWKRV